MLWCWQQGDIGRTPGFDGSLEKALGAISARTILMPAEKDVYFPPEDNAYELKHIPNAELRVILASGDTSPAAASTRSTPRRSTTR
jgi:homoserine O-acetyltransferase/O-succinyltransferase